MLLERHAHSHQSALSSVWPFPPTRIFLLTYLFGGYCPSLLASFRTSVAYTHNPWHVAVSQRVADHPLVVFLSLNRQLYPNCCSGKKLWGHSCLLTLSHPMTNPLTNPTGLSCKNIFRILPFSPHHPGPVTTASCPANCNSLPAGLPISTLVPVIYFLPDCQRVLLKVSQITHESNGQSL